MSMCMCICVFMCMWIYIYICVCVCMCMCVCMCVHAWSFMINLILKSSLTCHIYFVCIFLPTHFLCCIYTCYDRYWAALLLNMNVDIRAYDVRINPRNCWSKVRYGGPEILLNPKLHGKGRTRYYKSNEHNSNDIDEELQ